MLDIAGSHSRPDIFHEHLANAFRTVLLMQEILAQDRGGNLWHMFVLGDGGDLRLCQAAQTNTVFKGNHSRRLVGIRGLALRQIKHAAG